MLEQVILTNRLTLYALRVGFRESLSIHISKPEYDEYYVTSYIVPVENKINDKRDI